MSQELEDETRNRRSLRAKLFSVKEDFSRNTESLREPSKAAEMGDRLQELDEIGTQIKYAREGALEAEVYAQGTDIALKQVQNLDMGNNLNVDDFIMKLGNKYRDENEEVAQDGEEETYVIDWNKLCSDVLQRSYRPPETLFMNGPSGLKKKERKVRRRTGRVDGEEEKPEELKKDKRLGSARYIQKMSKNFKQSIESNEGKPVDFLDLVLDNKRENGFTKTVENMFYFSFLVKDARARMRITKNKQIKVDYVPENEAPRKKQSVMWLDLKAYKDLCANYEDRDEDEEDYDFEMDESVMEEEEMQRDLADEITTDDEIDEEADYEPDDEDKKKKKKKKRKKKKAEKKKKKEKTKKRKRVEEEKPRKRRKQKR